nr:MAG: putative capsid protein precursor [Labyrnavirus sp.]
MDMGKNKNNNKKQPETVSPKLDDGKTGHVVIDAMSLEELRVRDDLRFDLRTAKIYHKRVSYLADEEAKKLTEALLQRRAERRRAKVAKRLRVGGVIKAQSNVEGVMEDDAVPAVHQENVVDHVGDVPTQESAGASLADVDVGSMTEYSLDAFFARPVVLYDDTWAPNTTHNLSVRLWDEWSKDPSVRAKLNNYAFFKGNMKIRISVSGTPFHYGRILASYQPYDVHNSLLTGYDNLLASTTPGAVAINPYLGYLSQAPGRAIIDVSVNEPVEIDIPFVSHKPVWRLFNNSNSVITNAVSFDDFYRAGALRLVTLNVIKVANEDYDSNVSLNIYGWVENVELGCITATDLDITAQSKVKNVRKVGGKAKKSRVERFADKFATRDEYADPGPVQSIASTIADVGTRLSDVPGIGPFARATTTMATTAGKIASLFGWSKPVVLTDPIYVKNNPFTNGATTAGKDTTFKIAVDPKQELSIDPRIGGMDTDQMDISQIASRESYLTSFTWSSSATSLVDVLWRSLVTPMLFDGLSYDIASTRHSFVQPTAMMFAAAPFLYWRGTIKYRFEVVCSRFHRGKLLIRFEPNSAQQVLIQSNSVTLNQQNIVIMDIQDTQDLTIEVDWAQQRNFALNLANGPLALPYNATHAGTSTGDFSNNYIAFNGFLEVRALNDLVQPTDNSSVQVNVYVSCDDLMVAKPDETNLQVHRFVTAQSKVTEIINPTGAHLDGNALLENFGERIVSFRTVLKRYSTTALAYATYGSVSIGFVHRFTLLGMIYPSNISQVTVASPVINPPPNLFNYLRYGYMGVRGGYRHRIASVNTISASPSYTKVSLNIQENIFDTNNESMQVFRSAVSAGHLNSEFATQWRGGQLYSKATNAGIEFEMPFYSQSFFIFAFGDNYDNYQPSSYSYYDRTMPFRFVLTEMYGINGAGSELDTIAATDDTAAAEDFTFLRFQGAPFYTQTEAI